jgi:hypothetical protein
VGYYGILDGRRIESFGFTHPLGNEPLLTALGHYTVMTDTVNLLLPIDRDELTIQRMVRIADNKLFTLMMGSMLALRLAGQSTSCIIWLVIPIGSPFPTIACCRSPTPR